VSLVAKAKSDNREFKLPPAGTHVARCVQIVDLGTQKGEWQGKPKETHKVRLAWELPNEKDTFKPEVGPEPFIIGKDFTVSLDEKASLRKTLEAWRGRPFTEQELAGFDISKLKGVPAMLNVQHVEKGGKVYANVSAVMALPKGMPVPDQINKGLHFELEMGRDSAAFKALPEWLQKRVGECVEWAGAPAEVVEPEHESEPEEDPSEAVPF
jgi:hypothetical protein